MFYDITRSRRYDDNGTDLQRTFNRIQENLIKGGVRVKSEPDSYGRITTRHSREIKANNSNVKLNQALWMLAKEMKKIKKESVA